MEAGGGGVLVLSVDKGRRKCSRYLICGWGKELVVSFKCRSQRWREMHNIPYFLGTYF